MKMNMMVFLVHLFGSFSFLFLSSGFWLCRTIAGGSSSCFAIYLLLPPVAYSYFASARSVWICMVGGAG